MKPKEVKNKILTRLKELEVEVCYSEENFIKSKKNFLNFTDYQLYECKDLDFNFDIYILNS